MRQLLFVFMVSLPCLIFGDMQQEEFSQQFGQKLIIGFCGTSSEDNDVQEVRELIEKRLIAGVILFGQNIKSPGQVKALVSYLTKDQSVIVSIDQEGGMVSRINEKNGFAYSMPSAKSYKNEKEVYNSFNRIGAILADIGVTLNFAPVLDVDHDPVCPVIGGKERSFSDSPEVVVAYARAAIKGLADNGVESCGKHFPGHGSAAADTHLNFADVTDVWNRELELYPFFALQNELPYIMVSHTFNKNIDADDPASVSKNTYELLGGYKGKFVTDDYFMTAIAKKYSEAEFAIHAISAGASLVIFGCHPDQLALLHKQQISPKPFVESLHEKVYLAYKEGLFPINQ